MSGKRKSTGRLFHTAGPLTENVELVATRRPEAETADALLQNTGR